ncbi:hypothetical protein ACFYKX_26595 [Cytobacillus sp. FJAT-54145]|uniref:Lipoprotein n=1 Tax=Cytobacillus spartinae TaxID=3299023 RepID=A0ABW6KJ08_9BACI
MKKIMVFLSIFALTACGVVDKTNQQEDTITLEQFQKAQDEAYNLGYQDGLEAGKESKMVVPSSNSGLTLFSDGMDWDYATDLDKKYFIEDLSSSGVVFISISEVDDFVRAIDVFYEDQSNGYKSIKEAIEEIEGS